MVMWQKHGNGGAGDTETRTTDHVTQASTKKVRTSAAKPIA